MYTRWGVFCKQVCCETRCRRCGCRESTSATACLLGHAVRQCPLKYPDLSLSPKNHKAGRKGSVDMLVVISPPPNKTKNKEGGKIPLLPLLAILAPQWGCFDLLRRVHPLLTIGYIFFHLSLHGVKCQSSPGTRNPRFCVRCAPLCPALSVALPGTPICVETFLFIHFWRFSTAGGGGGAFVHFGGFFVPSGGLFGTIGGGGGYTYLGFFKYIPSGFSSTNFWDFLVSSESQWGVGGQAGC